MSLKVVGVEKAIANIDRFKRAVPQAVWSAYIVEAEELLTESKRECPVDTGNLRASGHADYGLAPSSVSDINIKVGYGGPAAAYALIQHENLEFNHTVGKAKYLEDPFNRRKKGMFERVAKRVREYMRSHGLS